MKVGDMVMRKTGTPEGVGFFALKKARDQNKKTGAGIILSKQMAGSPEHMCLTVYYPKVNKTYDIAESLMTVLANA